MSLFMFDRKVCAQCKASLYRRSVSGLCGPCFMRHFCVVCEQLKPEKVKGRWCADCETDYAKASQIREKLHGYDARSEAERNARVERYRQLAEAGLPLFEAA